MRFKLREKYYPLKYRTKDFIWNNRQILIPVSTGIGSIIWYIVDSSPEPIVLIVASFLSAFVLNAEKHDYWYTSTQGDIYEVDFRADTQSEEERKSKANEFIYNLKFNFKWTLLLAPGDRLNKLAIDTLVQDEKQFIEQAKKMFYVCYIKKNGMKIYDKYENEYV